uniref:Uncharacterized protein n=2 Tax=Lutzomyia longipalpis TaxID=7200 RepID=A0A1B0GI70_LUTLO
MSGVKKSFPMESGGKTDDGGAKRMRMCKESCGFLGALKSLMHHSVTTGATSLIIRMDLEYPYLQISDNGVGIATSEIEEIGKTTFLDVISAADDVSIETMTETMEKSIFIKFHKNVLMPTKSAKKSNKQDNTFDWLGSPSTKSSPEPSCSTESSCNQRQTSGTTFTLTNVHLTMIERFEKFSKNIVNYVKNFAIAHYKMSITLRDLKGNKLLFGTKKAKSITEKVASIYKLDGMEFNSMSKASSNIAIEIIWGTKLHHSSNIQLVFINGEPSTNNRLLKTVKKAWKCGRKNEHPVYVLNITIRVAQEGKLEQISHDSVIKDCIRECVTKLKSSCGDDISDEDDMTNDEGSVYFRSHLLLDVDKRQKEKKDKKDKKNDSRMETDDTSIFAVPLPPQRQENRIQNSPVKAVHPVGAVRTSEAVRRVEAGQTPEAIQPVQPIRNQSREAPIQTTNLSVNCSRSARQYLLTLTSSELDRPSPRRSAPVIRSSPARSVVVARSTPSRNTPVVRPSPISSVPRSVHFQSPQFALQPSPRNNTAFLAQTAQSHLQNLQNQVQDVMKAIEDLKKERERDQRRIQELTQENQDLLFSQRSSRVASRAGCLSFFDEGDTGMPFSTGDFPFLDEQDSNSSWDFSRQNTVRNEMLQSSNLGQA